MYRVYFDGVQLPVAPSQIKRKINNQNQSITLLNGGEINFLKPPGLTEIEFEILLPNKRYPFASYPDGFHDGQYYLDLLEIYKLKAKPFSLKIEHLSGNKKVSADFKMDVSLEEYTITEEVSQGVDFVVDIKLKEYERYISGKRAITKEENGETTIAAAEPQRESKKPEKSYTVQAGGSLWSIAQKALGSGARWQEIYNMNVTVIEEAAKKHGKQGSGNGRYIYQSTVLKLPE